MPRKKLTAVEWEVMEAVWALGGSPSVRQVLEYAYPGGEKAYTTVQTIMNTLERKGFLKRRKTGRSTSLAHLNTMSGAYVWLK